MLSGHSSHQIGLDADIWLTPMPNHTLTPEEREDMIAESMLKDPFTVDPEKWTLLHTKLIKRAASYPEVDRIFVHPAIKKVLCEQAGEDRAWLTRRVPGGIITTIFMCGSAAHSELASARGRSQRARTMVAGKNLPTGTLN